MVVERIEKEGKIYAMLPFEDFEALLEDAEMLDDIRAYDAAKARNETALPDDVWRAIQRSRGEGIAALRAYRGMTQKELSDKAGITQPYLSAIESGKNKGSAHYLLAIAKALSVKLDDILEGE